uniref:Uncharacterized protein n=1 Tax=Anguilla anguilla TaxID=7936 RepID=A0A0E9WBA3_ANGAN
MVFNLEVQVPSEPIVEEGLLHIAGGLKLHGHPVFVLVSVNVHWDMVHLSDPHKPVTLQNPDQEEQGDE